MEILISKESVTEVEMDKYNAAKHENDKDETAFKCGENQLVSTLAGNPSIVSQTSHQLPDSSQSNDWKFSSCQCLLRSVCNACPKQHNRSFCDKCSATFYKKADFILKSLLRKSRELAIWQKDPTEEMQGSQLRYWQHKLSGYETLNLITDFPRPSQSQHAEQFACFELDGNTSISLRNLAEELKVSLHAVLLSGYFLMLRGYCNQDDIVVATPIASGYHSRTENRISYFVNLLPIRSQIDSTSLLKDFIRQVGGDVNTSQLHQDFLFEKLVEKLAATEDLSRHPLLQVLFCVLNFQTFAQCQTTEKTDFVDVFELYTGKSPCSVASCKFDLTTVIDDSGSNLKGVFNYSTGLYKEETVHRYVETYAHILRQLSTLITNKTKKNCMRVADLSFLSADQYHKIIHTFNATDKEYPTHKTIPQLFEEQVEKTPTKIAVTYQKVKLTYKELNNRANQLANHLTMDYNIAPDNLVALCLDRSEHMIVAILAVLKAGGAYVPIDPTYPNMRIQYILEDTKTRLLLTNSIHQERLKNISLLSNSDQNFSESSHMLNILSVDSPEFQDILSSQPAVNPSTPTTSDHLAYVMYTSGTTGKPNGVMVEHRALVNLNFALKNRYALGSARKKEVILQFSNYVFDISAEQMILALLNGFELLLMPNQLWLTKEKFINYLIKHNVTHIQVTPRFLEQQNFRELVSLKRIVSAGEEFSQKAYDEICRDDKIKIINAYGPTEACVTSTCEITWKEDLNIGSPISNTKYYVLGANLVPVPIGAMGELYIGGEGLARGYLNRPDLTAERFIPNPFQTEIEETSGRNTRLYKTGDLVRWLPYGNVEYVGRKDFQVKIRGYRIELGEIESALLGYPGIKQCVALAKNHGSISNESSGNKYLVAYYVSGTKLDEESIFRYLESKLPEHMVPVILVHIDKLPLTINGKLDRKGLPDPECTNPGSYAAPRNKIQKEACQIWAEVLGLNADKVGIHDDFFKVGGDSITSILLVAALRKFLQLDVSVKDVFNCKSIAKLFESVVKTESSQNISSTSHTEQAIPVGKYPLLPMQERFFWRKFSAAHRRTEHFSMKTSVLSLSKLEESLVKLIQRHGAFRLRFKKDEATNAYHQYYHVSSKVEPVKVLNVRSLGYEENSQAFKDALENVLTNWQSNFNLTDGPIYCVGYTHGYQDGSARIYIALHQLIVDSVSWRILSEDLSDIYHDKRLGSEGGSYHEWAEALQNYSRSHPEERDYWNSILSHYESSELHKLVVSESTVNYASVKLSEECSASLLHASNRAYNTRTNDLLLTALGYSLQKITRCSINHIMLEGHGREDIDSIDVTRTVGCFTKIYPVRIEICPSLKDIIKSVKEYLRKVPNKGLGYGSIIGYKSNDLPKVHLKHLSKFSQEMRIELKDKYTWQIVAEGSGLPINFFHLDANIIHIECLMTEGRLEFRIISKLNEEATNKFARVFKDHLETVLKHTCNQQRSYLTPSDIDNIISNERLDALQEQREIEAIFLANSLQQGFIYHALSQGNVDDAYIVQTIWQYCYPINIKNLNQAWEYGKAKFSSLRLRFDWQENLVQVIDKKGRLDWRYLDLGNESNVEKQEHMIGEIQQKDRLEKYDLAQGNLFRVYLIKQNTNLYSCIFSNHHAILDGWSMPILLGYVHDTYLKLDRKEAILVQPDNAFKAAQQYIQRHYEDDQAFWDKYIAQVEERSDLSVLPLRSEKSQRDYKHILRPADITLTITGNVYSSLKLLSSQEGVTLNSILQYVWHKVLNVYGNSKQTIVGTTISGRSIPVNDTEKSVGLYINTLPLIVDHQANRRLIDLIRDVQCSIGELNSRSTINLAKLQPSGERLFESLFVYENYPNPTSEAQDEIKLKFKGCVEKLDYPLNVTVHDFNDKFTFNLQYAGELFSTDTINNLLHLTRTLLEQIASNPHQALTSLKYLNTQQYGQIIRDFNTTDKEYPTNKTIHALFEEQVEITPDSIAIVYKDVHVTYRELNERANKLANYLIGQCNIEPDSLVPLCLDRSEHMIIAILAVLKSGGAYVPIDPSYPDERIQYILQDTGSSVLLTNEMHQGRFEGISCLGSTSQEYPEARRTLCIISIDSQEFEDKFILQAVSNPNTITTGSHLAYVIFTSGTTGKPKGVMVEHGGLINLNHDLRKRYELNDTNDGEVILQFSNYVFDTSVEQIMLGLLNGHVLLLIPNQLWLNEEKFHKYLLVNKVTHLDVTPRFLEQHDFGEISSLKRIICGGELLSKQSYDKIRVKNKIKLINSYGLTETSITSTVHIVGNGNPNIGSPISNTKCYVLDDNLLPLPPGAVGELCIGGAGLARGYLNRSELTAERFIPNPFQTEIEIKSGRNTRLFKTGDLVRWLPGGNLEYVGRNDFQVKIRGYRIELEEIESTLLGHPGIKQCAAVCKNHTKVPSQLSGNKYLVAYYVSGTKLDEESIFRYLESKLPEYMVPVKLFHMDKLPLTISGKLDRKAFPDPDFTSPARYVGPRSEIEEKILQIWAEVLGLAIDKVGIHDDFFRLGGDSIVSIQLVGRLQKKTTTKC